MFQLVESIKLLDGAFQNLHYHEERMRWSLQKLFANELQIELSDMLSQYIIPSIGLYKCRLLYDVKGVEVEFIPYVLTMISSLKVVDSNSIEYSYKFTDRTEIDNLFKQRAGCDDILIVKDGLVRDSSYGNVIFKQDNRWFTPLNPLLKGVKRKELLDRKEITVREISINNIKAYESVKLINAMRGFDSQEIDVSKIVF